MPKKDTPVVALPPEGYVRLQQIIGPGRPIPVSKSNWWEGVSNGRYPQPIKLSPRVTAWRVEDIRALIESPKDAGSQNRAEEKDDEAAQAEAKRREDDEVDNDTLEAA